MLKKTVRLKTSKCDSIVLLYADQKLHYVAQVTSGHYPDLYQRHEILHAIRDDREWTRHEPESPLEAAIQFVLYNYDDFNVKALRDMADLVILQRASFKIIGGLI